MDIHLIILGGFIAFFATIIGAFAGGGSSLITFPLLLVTMPGSYMSLLIVSKISAAVMTITSSNVHLRKVKLHLPLILVLITAGILGTILGTYILLHKFNEELFKKLLIVLIFFSAIYVLLTKKRGLDSINQKKITPMILLHAAVASFAINTLNGILGGTGLLMNIYLVGFLGMSFIQAIAYTMLTYAFLSSIQAIYLGITQSFDLYLAISVTIGAVAGGHVGTNLQYLKGNVWVRNASIIALLLIGLEMLLE